MLTYSYDQPSVTTICSHVWLALNAGNFVFILLHSQFLLDLRQTFHRHKTKHATKEHELPEYRITTRSSISSNPPQPQDKMTDNPAQRQASPFGTTTHQGDKHCQPFVYGTPATHLNGVYVGRPHECPLHGRECPYCKICQPFGIGAPKTYPNGKPVPHPHDCPLHGEYCPGQMGPEPQRISNLPGSNLPGDITAGPKNALDLEILANALPKYAKPELGKKAPRSYSDDQPFSIAQGRARLRSRSFTGTGTSPLPSADAVNDNNGMNKQSDKPQEPRQAARLDLKNTLPIYTRSTEEHSYAQLMEDAHGSPQISIRAHQELLQATEQRHKRELVDLETRHQEGLGELGAQLRVLKSLVQSLRLSNKR